MMLMQEFRKTVDHTCYYGWKCCTSQNGKHTELRRTARRIEKRNWKKENNV